MPASVDSEIVLFEGATGTEVKRATGSGLVKVTSGVMAIASAGTDYAAATAVARANHTGSQLAATISDFAAAADARVALATSPQQTILTSMPHAALSGWTIAFGSNDAIFVRVDPIVDATYTRIVLGNGAAAAGNIDIGVRHLVGTNLVEVDGTGSTAMAGTGVGQSITFGSPVDLIGGDVYYLYLALSDTSARFLGTSMVIAGAGGPTLGGYCYTKTPLFPVTGTADITLASLTNTNSVPFIFLAT